MHRRLPVTLIGGFLGAGKTSLLHHLIAEHQGGHLAVLVESPSVLNPDAKALRGLCGAMRRLHDTVEEIPVGDETMQREAVEASLREFVSAGRYERVLFEVGGTTNAARWGRQFTSDSLGEWAEVCQIVCVVDLLDFHRAFVASESSRTSKPLPDFQRAQIEGATVIVLNKCDLAGDAERQQSTRVLRGMNPDARIIETDYGEVPPEIILCPAPAIVRTSVKKSAEEEQSLALESVVYRAHRPFHPQRFWDWFNAPHDGLLRMKGIIWLATRSLLVGGVSRTAWQNGCGAAGIWWAALPREEWPTDPEALMQMQDNWREPYGDRRQELVLIGESGPTGTAARQLNLCLLTEEEYAWPLADWLKFPDPFPAWDLDEN